MCRICVYSTHSSASPTCTHISHTIHPYLHPYRDRESERTYRHHMDRYTTISVLRRAFGFEYTIHISIPVDFRCRYMQSSERKSTILTKTIQLLRLRACTAHTQFFFSVLLFYGLLIFSVSPNYFYSAEFSLCCFDFTIYRSIICSNIIFCEWK